jgi:D-sedoheptulose 7-phosphate isomerase
MTKNSRHQELEAMLAESVATISSLEGILRDLAGAAALMTEGIRSGGAILAFGNGGSAAQAQHFAAELVGRFQLERAPLSAIALTTDTSALTSIGNDYGFEEIFARQVHALGRQGDLAFAISTSGNSSNVLRALDAAREKSLRTIGLTGRDGGKMRERVDLCLCVPSQSTARIQEAHMVILHLLCQMVETAVLPGPAPR